MAFKGTEEAKNIMVRNLNGSDHQMLAKLRDKFKKQSNAAAILYAGYQYLSLLEKYQILEEERSEQESVIGDLTLQLSSLKEQMNEYFSLETHRAQVKAQIIDTIDEK